MDWLMHNPIADMRGPDFLRLYAVVIVFTLALAAWVLHLRDPTRMMSVPSIPTEVDPYEIAYLRGGTNEVIRLVILNLIQRGYLQRQAAEDRIYRSTMAPDARHLNNLERAVFRWFESSRSADEIFKDGGLEGSVRVLCTGYSEKLQRDHLLLPEGRRGFQGLIIVLGLAILLGLGGYKFVVALIKGRHNVEFLFAMAIVSAVVLLFITNRMLPRTSKRGREYLKKLRLGFNRFKGRIRNHPASEYSDDLAVLASVYGIGVLAGTTYDYYPKMFRRAESSSSSSGCGSSCGSSCGSGCGGGGGCGGCGS